MLYTIPATDLRRQRGHELSTEVAQEGHHVVITRSMTHTAHDPDPQVSAVVVPFAWWAGFLTEDPPSEGLASTREGKPVQVVSRKLSHARADLTRVLDAAVKEGKHTIGERWTTRTVVFMPPRVYQAWTGVSSLASGPHQPEVWQASRLAETNQPAPDGAQ